MSCASDFNAFREKHFFWHLPPLNINLFFRCTWFRRVQGEVRSQRGPLGANGAELQGLAEGIEHHWSLNCASSMLKLSLNCLIFAKILLIVLHYRCLIANRNSKIRSPSFPRIQFWSFPNCQQPLHWDTFTVSPEGQLPGEQLKVGRRTKLSLRTFGFEMKVNFSNSPTCSSWILEEVEEKKSGGGRNFHFMFVVLKGKLSSPIDQPALHGS